MGVAEPLEQRAREDRVDHLGFLQAQDVRRFLAQELLDDGDPRADRIDVPGGDLQRGGHGRHLGTRVFAVDVWPPLGYGKAPAPGAWSGGQPSVCHAGATAAAARATGGNPETPSASARPFLGSVPVAPMNESSFLALGAVAARVVPPEGVVGNADVECWFERRTVVRLFCASTTVQPSSISPAGAPHPCRKRG